MTEEKKYTLAEAQYHFAVDFHRKTWEMLEKQNRNDEDNARMINYAHASLSLWYAAGTAARHQRGEWLLSRIYAVLGDGKLAIHHAHRCLKILEGNKNEMEDFDFAFAYEAIARALAVNGDKSEAKRFFEKAQKAGEEIKEKEDRDAFFVELNGGEWNGAI